MKTLKKILIAFVALICILLIVAIFLPSEARVERSIVIDASANDIATNIVDLHAWDNWSSWKEADSAAEYKYNDTIGMGAWMEWTGKIIGKGKLTLKKTTADSIIYLLEFFEPYESSSQGSFSFSSDNSGIKVTWKNISELTWPIGRIMGLFMNLDEMMGPDFEKGLAKLKTTSENSYKYSYEVKEKEINSTTLAVIRNKVKSGEIGNILGKSYGEIQAYIAKNGAKMTGSPMAITMAWDSLSWDFEAAIPIDKEIPGNDRIQIKKSYAGKVIYVEYTGPYDGTYQAYTDLDVYQKKKGYTEAGGPWEVYVTDPGMEPDTSQWVTEIYFPVK